MSSYSYTKAAWTVDRLIRKYGFHETSKGGKTYLRRDGTDRICRSVETFFEPREIDGEKIQRTDRRFLVSTKTTIGPMQPAPDDEQDVFVITGSTESEDSSEVVLILQSPPRRLAPAGVMVYWELHLRSR